MSKGSGGGSPQNTTTTVKNQPYLSSQVQDAANYAKNLYLGKSSTASATPTQSTTSGTMYVGPDGRVYDTASAGWYNQYIQNNPNANQGGGGGTSAAADPTSMAGFRPLSTTQTMNADTGGTQVTPEGWPEFFPGQTYVDYSPETLQALNMITNRAQSGSALNTSANQSVLDTINGNYLNGNPYIDSVINQSLGDVNKKYAEQVLPGLASNFASSGRYGSGIQQNMTANAVGQLGKEAMGVASGIRYDNYNQERQRQLQAAALAPTLAQGDYYDAQQLMGVGSARESLNQAKLQDAMDRFNYNENQPSRMLDEYIARIGALNGGYGTQTSTGPGQQVAKPSPFAGALSGGAAGLGIGSMMAAPGATGMAALGGPWGIGLGIGGA